MNASSWSYFFISLITLSSLNAIKNDSIICSERTEKSSSVKTRRARKQVTKKADGKRSYVNQMDYEQLKKMQEKAIAEKNNFFAIKCTEQLIKICTDNTKHPELLLTLAQLYFDNEDFEQAVQWYAEFTLLYPGRPDQEIEFALYQKIRAQNHLTMTIDRDQTNTQKVIAMANDLLSHPRFTTYKQEVIEIRQNAYQKLVESELYISSFYANVGDIRAAQRRIDFVRDQYSTHIPDLEAQVLIVEQTLQQHTPEITIDHVDQTKSTVALNTTPNTTMKDKF